MKAASVKNGSGRLLRFFAEALEAEIVRYFLAGVAVSIGYTALVWLLVDGFGLLSPSIASAVSFTIWTPISYVVHRDFTFGFVGKDREAASRFLLMFLVRLLFSWAAVYVVDGVLHWHYLFGALLNWIILPLVNFAALQVWVFSKGAERAGDEQCPTGQALADWAAK